MCVNWEKYSRVGNKYWLKAKKLGILGENIDQRGKI
jgi:hypothetical protein